MATKAQETAQDRLTEHYIGKLRRANIAIRHNRDNSSHWYQAIEQDWAQIENWQQWVAQRSTDHPQYARLCAAFGLAGDEYVSVRLTVPERLRWYRQALLGALQSDDQPKERELLYLVGTTEYQTGSFEEAERCAKRLLEAGRSPRDHRSLGYGWFIIGNIHSHRTELDQAESAFHKALAHFEKCHAEVMAGHALQGIARIMTFRGQYAEALIYATRYLEIIAAAGRESDFSLAYHTLSNIHTRLGNLAQAKSYALKAVENSRRLGYARMIPSNLLILGYAELGLNELDAAWGHFQETITASRASLSKFDQTAATFSLGDVRSRQNNLAEALDYYQQALALATESNIAAYRSLCSIEIANVHAQQHEIGAARSALRVGAETALEIKSTILLAKALIPAIKLWQAMGILQSAAEWSGLLSQHPEHAEQNTVDEISRQLESNLGVERYRRAFERGKSLTLNDVVTDVIKMLDLLDMDDPHDVDHFPPGASVSPRNSC